MSITRMDLNARMSQIVVHNGIVYLSGQVAEDWSTGIVGQTEQILKKIENLLAKAGSDKSKILSTQIWLADAREFDDMNGVWEAWIDPENPPARATCETNLAHQDVRVEIMIIAAV